MSDTISTTVKTKTLVKKIVVGTPVRRVTSGAFSVDNLDGFSVANQQDFDIFVYDSNTGNYVSSRLEFTGGLSKSYDRDSDTLTISLDATGVTAGTYGTDSNFPYFTVDSQGQLTLAGTINLNTNYITEGAENVFYTDARVMSALDSISTSIRPDTDGIYNLGDSSHRFKDLFLSGNTIYVGGLKLQDENTSLTVTDSSGTPAPIVFGSLFANDSSRIDDNLSVKDNLLVGGSIVGSVNVTDSTSFDNNVSIDGNLLVGGTTSLNGTLTASDSAQFQSNISIDGNTIIGGDLTINDSVRVEGNASVGNNLLVGQTLHIDGGTITGPSTMTLDPAGVGDNTGTVVIKGGLQVDGTTTTINSTTLEIDDKNIVLAAGALNPLAADGAGITIDAGIASIVYDASTDRWVFDKTIYADKGLNVDDSASFGSNLVVDGTVLVGTDLTVNNDLTAATLTGVYLGFDSDLARDTTVQTIRGYFSASGDLTYDSATGRFQFDVEQVYTKTNFDSDLNLALSTDAVTTNDLTEGANNLYYTRARFDSALADSFSTQAIRNYFNASGDLSYEPTTGTFFFDVEDVYTKANFDSDFNVALDEALLGGIGLNYNSTTNTINLDSAELAAYFSTNDITEGNNLYYTRARFDSALGDSASTQTIRDYISVVDNGGDGSLQYIPTTGQIVYTGPSASEVRSHLSASGDLTYDSATGRFSIDVEQVYTAANFDSDLDAAIVGGVGLNYNTSTNAVNIDSAELAAYFSTGNITEGGNLYYTRARFDSALGDSLSTQTIRDYFSAGGDLTYEPTTGQFSIDVEQVYTQANFDSDFNTAIDAAALDGIGLAYNSTTNTLSIDSAELSAYYSTDDITEGSNLYYTKARVDSDVNQGFNDRTTSDLAEGSNLYYTTARADSDFDVRLATKSTTDVSEGNNLYYTKVRVDSDIEQGFNDRTTDALTEGSTNLYYTSARADSDAKNAISVTDAGGDGSLSYNNGTGVITYTGPSASEVRAHFAVGANGLSYNSSTGVFDIDSTSTVFLNNLNVTNNVVITGNLQVNGTQTIINTENLSVEDNMIYLNQLESAGSPTQFVDVGFAANYNDIGSYAHTGFFRDATDGVWKLFRAYTPEPDSDLDIDVNHPSFAYAPLRVESLTADTLTGIYQGFDSDFNAKSTTDLSEGSNLYYTKVRVDSDVNQGFTDRSTSDLSEGSNLYYTTTRADSDFDVRLATKTTTDLSEGNNLYYTKVRVDSDVNQGFTDRTTSNLAEGSNLYYTTARADSDARNAISVVDNGGDGSLTYTTSTGVITYTGPSASEIRSHFSAAGDLTYDSATGRFEIDVEASYTSADFDSDLGDASTDLLPEGTTNLYYTTARADSDFDVRLATKTTTDVAEGTNLYYTTVRSDSDFDVRFVTKSTTDLSEGVNLYYTSARVDSDFDARFTTKTTDDLTEGSVNLYYTKLRTDSDIQAYLVGNSYATETYVDSNIAVAVANLVDGAPAVLDTLNELAAALNNDSDFAGTVTSQLALKFDSADFASTFDGRFATKTTDDLTQGSTNLYYDSDRVVTSFDTQFGVKTTTDLAEGTNLYYTKLRVDSDISDLVDSAYVAARTPAFVEQDPSALAFAIALG